MPVFNTRGKFDLRGQDVGSVGNRQFNWEDFSGGLNTLFRETEIKDNELAQAQNLQLVGKGVPTKASGTAVYFLANESGSVRGLQGFYQKDGSNQLLSITDTGFLTKRSNASYTTLTGASWASGYPVEMTQLDDKMYIVNGQRELARYSNPTLVGFPTIAAPSSLFATQISGTSGTNTYSYVLTHITDVGETAGSNPYQFTNQPLDPSLGSTKLSWTNASSASGTRVGTNIYGRTAGTETFLARVDGEATQWIDDGTSIPQLFAFVPLADSTGGPIAKYVKRFKDRLIYSGIAGDPTMVLISGRLPNHEKFDFGSGGGFVRIEPDSGDEIVGLETKGDKILVFKQRSIWEVNIEQVQIGNFYLIEPKYRLITSSIGSAGQRSIAQVENDIFFLASSNRGVYVIGNEPGIIGDLLRTNEISVKIRPFFQNITAAEEMNAAVTYSNGKFYLTIPGKNQTMVFDRERQAWMGPWTFDGSILHVYYDTDTKPHLLIGSDSTPPEVLEISDQFSGHKGVAMGTILRTKREDFKTWSSFKNIQSIYTRWRNIVGSVSVDIRLEGTSGNTLTQKSFNVVSGSGNSGWGADQWANTQWGDSEESGESRDLNELIREALLNETARNVQMIVKTTGLIDDYELMAIRGEANEIGPAIRPHSWLV